MDATKLLFNMSIKLRANSGKEFSRLAGNFFI